MGVNGNAGLVQPEIVSIWPTADGKKQVRSDDLI